MSTSSFSDLTNVRDVARGAEAAPGPGHRTPGQRVRRIAAMEPRQDLTRQDLVPHDRTRQDLMRRGTALLNGWAHDTHDGAAGTSVALTHLGALDDRLAAVAEQLMARLRGGDRTAQLAEAGGMLADVQAARHEVADFLVHERLLRLDSMQRGLAELRLILDPEELVDRVCGVVVGSCGFHRAMLSRIDGSTWRPWKSYSDPARVAPDAVSPDRVFPDRDDSRDVCDWISLIPQIELDRMFLESEMVRRLEPAMTTDGQRDPRVHRAMLSASGLKSYVAAPILPMGRVIALLHADQGAAVVDVLDRDILWAFATGFGQIYERAVLLRRLRLHRAQARTAMDSVISALDELTDADIELPDGTEATVVDGVPLGQPPSQQNGGLDSLLTGRELQVLKLMATGATNHRIGERLVITDGTVKSHVKSILRKLHATNRSEAVSQFLHLTI